MFLASVSRRRIIGHRLLAAAHLGAVLLAGTSTLAEELNVFNEDEIKISLWNTSVELRGGLGYKDNVLLSHTNRQGSAFWASGAEVLLFRLPTHGWQAHFFADASDVRYFNSPSVDNEQLAVAAGQLRKDFERGWRSTAGLTYLFQNQVFDFSETYTNQESVGQIRGHTVAPRVGVRKGLARYWVEGEFSGTRQWLDAPLDDYWQFAPRAVVGRGWQRGSELALSFQFQQLQYDTREQVNSLGAAIEGTSLALASYGTELSLVHYWDSRRRWQTLASLSYEANRDNGSGFFDYDSVRLSQQLRYRDEKWQITARLRVSHSEFSTQKVAVGNTASRRKTLLNLSLRVERELTKHLKAHASYQWDRSVSNLDFDDYEAGAILGGVAVTF